MKMKIIVNDLGTIEIMKDDPEWGIDSTVIRHQTFDVRGEYNSADELLKTIQNKMKPFGWFQYYKPSDYFFNMGVIITSDTITADGKPASESDVEMWRRKELDLYAAELKLYLEVERRIQHEMTYDDAKSLGFETD